MFGQSPVTPGVVAVTPIAGRSGQVTPYVGPERAHYETAYFDTPWRRDGGPDICPAPFRWSHWGVLCVRSALVCLFHSTEYLATAGARAKALQGRRLGQSAGHRRPGPRTSPHVDTGKRRSNSHCYQQVRRFEWNVSSRACSSGLFQRGPACGSGRPKLLPLSGRKPCSGLRKHIPSI